MNGLTVVSIGNGRKDYPVFLTNDKSQVLEYLLNNDWSEYKVKQDEEGDIFVNFGENRDIFSIVNVQIVEFK